MIDVTKPKLSEFSLDDADIYALVNDDSITFKKAVQERKKIQVIKIIWDNFNTDLNSCTGFVNEHWNEWKKSFPETTEPKPETLDACKHNLCKSKATLDIVIGYLKGTISTTHPDCRDFKLANRLLHIIERNQND